MPLPQAAYGSSAAGLTVDDNSGVRTSRDETDSVLDPTLTRAVLAKMGFVVAFQADFDDLAHVSRRGRPLVAVSEVALFKKPAGAARNVARERNIFRHLAGRQLADGEIYDHAVSFSVPGIRGAHGIAARIRLGPFKLWVTAAVFRVGVLTAGLELGRTDAHDVRADVRRLALVLRTRIRGVLAGKVKDAPVNVEFAKLGGLGRPRGGPNLAKMTVSPNDLTGHVKPTRQRYVRDHDDVAEYVRDFKSVRVGSSDLSSLQTVVELGRTAKTPQAALAFLKALFSGAQGRAYLRKRFEKELSNKPGEVKLRSFSTTNLVAGDEAWAYSAVLRNGPVRVQVWFCAMRRGPVLVRFTLVGLLNQPVKRIDVARVARIASARIDLELHR